MIVICFFILLFIYKYNTTIVDSTNHAGQTSLMIAIASYDSIK
jgi:hypothetical protein